MKQLHEKLRQIFVFSLDRAETVRVPARRLEAADLATNPVLIFDRERVDVNTKPLSANLRLRS